MLGEHKLSSPSTRLKVNRLCIRYLCFEYVRGDLQEGLVYDKRFCGYASRCQFHLFSSTKSGFLCFFAVWNPHFRASRAQNRGFCALLGLETLVFGLFEHKIRVFVLGLLLSAASGRVIADFFEILHGVGWHKAPLAGKASVMIGYFGDKLLV